MYRVEIGKRASKQISKLDNASRRRVESWLLETLDGCENPRAFGRALTGKRDGGYWRYRVGDYRVVCDIQDSRLVVLAVRVEHRGEVYAQRRHEH